MVRGPVAGRWHRFPATLARRERWEAELADVHSGPASEQRVTTVRSGLCRASRNSARALERCAHAARVQVDAGNARREQLAAARLSPHALTAVAIAEFEVLTPVVAHG